MGAGDMVSPDDAFIAQHNLLRRQGIVEHQYVRDIEGEADDAGAFQREGVVLLVGRISGSVEIDVAFELFPMGHRISQQRTGLVQQLVDDEGIVHGIGHVADAGHRMIQRQHEDLVGMPGLAQIADGGLGGTPGRDQSHLLAGDAHVAVIGHVRTPVVGGSSKARAVKQQRL